MQARWIARNTVPRLLNEVSLHRLVRQNTNPFSTFEEFRISEHWKPTVDASSGYHVITASQAGAEIEFAFSGPEFAFSIIPTASKAALSVTIDDLPPKSIVVLDKLGGRNLEEVCLFSQLGLGKHVVRLQFSSQEEAETELSLSMLFYPIPIQFGHKFNADLASDLFKRPPLDNFVAVHRLDTDNVGDLMCNPASFFSFLNKAPTIDILSFDVQRGGGIAKLKEQVGGRHLIVGGGGLLECDYFAASIAEILGEHRAAIGKVVIWGAGHNGASQLPWLDGFNSFGFTHERLALIGVRDFGSRLPWTPCVSCMAPEFDQNIEIKREFGFYIHRYRSGLRYLERYVRPEDICDNSSPFELAVKFLAESEYVISDSFHGVYWATLLGRKAISIPSGAKFHSLRHPVPQSGFEDWRTAVPLARAYPEALEECRAANVDFATQVYNYLMPSIPGLATSHCDAERYSERLIVSKPVLDARH